MAEEEGPVSTVPDPEEDGTGGYDDADAVGDDDSSPPHSLFSSQDSFGSMGSQLGMGENGLTSNITRYSALTGAAVVTSVAASSLGSSGLNFDFSKHPDLAPEQVFDTYAHLNGRTGGGTQNLRAFLDMVSVGEGTFDKYDICVGGSQFAHGDKPDQWQFPNKLVVVNAATGLASTAAGRPQFTKATWDQLSSELHLSNFSPSSQVAGYCELLYQARGVNGETGLDLVREGKFQEAVHAVNHIWASMDGSPYGQRTIKMSDLEEVYKKAGGTLYDPSRSPEAIADATPTAPSGRRPAQPLAATLGPSATDEHQPSADVAPPHSAPQTIANAAKPSKHSLAAAV